MKEQKLYEKLGFLSAEAVDSITANYMHGQLHDISLEIRIEGPNLWRVLKKGEEAVSLWEFSSMKVVREGNRWVSTVVYKIKANNIDEFAARLQKTPLQTRIRLV